MPRASRSKKRPCDSTMAASSSWCARTPVKRRCCPRRGASSRGSSTTRFARLRPTSGFSPRSTSARPASTAAPSTSDAAATGSSSSGCRGVPLTEVGDFDVWRQASGWLAGMHGRLARDPGLAARRRCRAPRAVRPGALREPGWSGRNSTWRLTRHNHGRAASALPRWRRSTKAVLDEIAALPSGFVHGEFFASNVLVETAAGQVRVRPVDWEARGNGSDAHGSRRAHRRPLDGRRAGGAGDQLSRGGQRGTGTSLSHDDFMRALDCCRLQLAVQRLGWARQWTPPATHTQDWLGEALHAADRLGL